jgi:hypothetical protein
MAAITKNRKFLNCPQQLYFKLESSQILTVRAYKKWSKHNMSPKLSLGNIINNTVKFTQKNPLDICYRASNYALTVKI